MNTTAIAKRLRNAVIGLERTAHTKDVAQVYVRLNEVRTEIETLSNILEEGNYVGSCPYCGHGEIFVVKGQGAFNLGELGKEGCCCRDLVKEV